MNVLFMCVANSARSQLAEGLARKLFGTRARVESAGSKPSELSPFAVQALQEIRIDISKHRSKSVEELPADFTGKLDYVITLCEEEVCPVILSDACKIHWPIPDPAGRGDTDEERLSQFRIARNAIKKRLEEFVREADL